MPRLALAAAVCALAATESAAFEFTNECRGPVIWNTNTITMEPSGPDFPLGSAARAAVEEMRTGWNAGTPGSLVTVNYTYAANDAPAVPAQHS